MMSTSSNTTGSIMDKKRSYRADYILLCVLIVTIAVLLAYMLERYHLNDELEFEPNRDIVANPMMGYAPYAQELDKCAEAELVFIKLKWSDWEPEMGRYDTGFLERTYHISRWKAEGKHGVLRFICDEPGQEGHADIPQWLLEETGDGTHYSGSYGSGYSPNYENAYFIDRHTKAVTALANYFNQDDFLAYVELGSLGFWGEWHARDEMGNSLMPSAQTCWDYVLPYTDMFRNARFLMRRSYVQAVDAGLGLYNDVLGDREQTQRWLGWTESGGSQDTAVDQLEILPYPAFWETAPVGGELTSQPDKQTLLGQGLSDLLDQVEACHLTFIGPYTPDPKEDALAYEAILRRVGYRYYVSRLSTTFSFVDNALALTLDWENAGSAPLYWDWPVILKVFDSQENLVYWETLELELSQLAPGKVITTTTNIPYLDSIRDGMSVGITINSYDGSDTVQLAMDTQSRDDSQIIYSFQRES